MSQGVLTFENILFATGTPPPKALVACLAPVGLRPFHSRKIQWKQLSRSGNSSVLKTRAHSSYFKERIIDQNHQAKSEQSLVTDKS